MSLFIIAFLVMNLVWSSLSAQTSLTTKLAQYDVKVDDSVTYRTGQNVIKPYNIGSRYKDLSAIVKNLVDTVRSGGTGGVDSFQTVVNAGKNSTRGIRFGSGADVASISIDSSTITTKTTVTNFARFNATGLIAFTSGGRYDYSYNGFTRFDLSTGYNTRVYIPTTTVSNKTVTIQDKSGTLALLTDIPDTTRYLLKSDTSALLVTHADLNTHSLTSVNLNGNTVGGTMVYGVIDSYNRVEQNYNAYDTVYARGLHSYNGKWSEVVASFYNNNTTTGARQSNSVNIVCGTGTVSASNTPAITFGVPNATTSPRLSVDGLTGYSVLNLYSSTSSGSIIKPAFQGSNTGDALTVSLGSYTIANSTPTTGNLNAFRIGTGYLSTGRFAPTSGSGNLRGMQGALYINATSTWSGTVKMFTDDSVTLAGLASGTYIGYEANQNSGWGFRQNGASAKNSFVGRTTFGTTTDNGSDAVQVVGDLNLTTAGNKIKIATGSNASIGTGTLSSGTATISTTAVTASSRIFLTGTAQHTLYVSATVAGTSFTVSSSSSSDNSTFNWLIIN